VRIPYNRKLAEERSLNLMTICESIEFDVGALDCYFHRLFALIKELAAAAASPPGTPDETYVGDPTAFARPDMACNVYSLVDFWLTRLAAFHQKQGGLPLSYRDIKGKNDLDVYHKYFTRVARLQLDFVAPSWGQLNSLRKVRNCLIHCGGHVEPSQGAELEGISGVSVFGSLVVITDNFIWESLEHAKLYLLAVGEAESLTS
jgi:hypothetical protein